MFSNKLLILFWILIFFIEKCGADCIDSGLNFVSFERNECLVVSRVEALIVLKIYIVVIIEENIRDREP